MLGEKGACGKGFLTELLGNAAASDNPNIGDADRRSIGFASGIPAHTGTIVSGRGLYCHFAESADAVSSGCQSPDFGAFRKNTHGC